MQNKRLDLRFELVGKKKKVKPCQRPGVLLETKNLKLCMPLNKKKKSLNKLNLAVVPFEVVSFCTLEPLRAFLPI